MAMTLVDDLLEEAREILRLKRNIIEMRKQHRKIVLDALQTEDPKLRKQLVDILVMTSTEEFEKTY